MSKPSNNQRATGKVVKNTPNMEKDDQEEPVKHEMKFTDSQKRQLFYKMQQCGWNSVHFLETALACDVPRREASVYFNKHIKAAQFASDKKIKNYEGKWLNVLKATDLPSKCLYEQAAVLNAIAQHEDQPTLEQMGGVDLRAVYKFLANALLGLPQPPLNKESTQFLAVALQDLWQDINGDDSAIDSLKKQLQLKEEDEILKKTSND